MRVILILVAAAALLMMLFPAMAAGQAQFHEDFEDIGAPSYSTPSSLGRTFHA